jgi:hypothetical protein
MTQNLKQLFKLKFEDRYVFNIRPCGRIFFKKR